MLKSHFGEVERTLLQVAKIPANSGHSIHKGTPREHFIREFLERHLSENVAIGTGEIIDANSIPSQPRNQIDIVLYKRNYPKLSFGGGICGFLVESVVATIEVKSVLDKEGLTNAMRVARNTKLLEPNISGGLTAGYQPPGILSYVVAYDGPTKMDTVFDWIPSICEHEAIMYPDLPADDDKRLTVASPAIDAVFVLGRGFIHYGNVPIGFFNKKHLEQMPQAKWICAQSTVGGLLLLFLFLTSAVSGLSASFLNPMPYLRGFRVESNRVDTGFVPPQVE
jgi:hypothetical protein